jgi:hypothetical protein
MEVEVIEYIPPQNFNPPLTGPFDPILIQLNGPFGDPFS